MKRWFLLGIGVIVCGNIGAQFSKVGTTGAAFLKIYAEPRGTGMAGACIASASDVTSLYWNPAGMAFVEKPELLSSHMDWMVDIWNHFIGFVMPRGLLGTFGLSITALTMGKEEVTTVAEPEGTGKMFGASSIAVGFSYAKQLTDRFAFGATGKYIQERIWDVTSNGLALDLGSWLKVSETVRGAFVITNFGTDMCFKGGHLALDIAPYDWPEGWTDEIGMERRSVPYSLPLSFHMGTAYDIILGKENSITLGAVLTHPNDGSEKLKFGGEYGLKQTLFLRVGYIYDGDVWTDVKDDGVEDTFLNKIRYGNRGSFGAGVKTKIGGQEFIVNYAAYYMRRLGLRNQVSVDIGF